MPQTLLLLVVTDEEAVAELTRRVLADNAVDAMRFVARNAVEAVHHAQTQPLGLVVVDLDLQGAVSGQDVCLKLRALHPSLPILPLGRVLSAAPFLSDIGCAPLLLKQRVIAEPSLFTSEIQAAVQQEPSSRLSPGTWSYVLERVDAVLLEQQRRDQPEVLVVCQQMFLRCGLAHTLAALGFRVEAAVANIDELRETVSASDGTGPVVGPLNDIAIVRAAARELGRPALAIGIQQRDFAGPAPAELEAVSLLLFDETGDLLQLLQALQRIATGQRLLVVPPAVIARWVAPLGSLPGRAWEVLVTLLLTSGVEEAARVTGIEVSSVEAVIKRVRRRLGNQSLSEILEQVRRRVVGQLGVLPEVRSRNDRARLQT
jgi:CheY-like chemotaxis protein